jgi:hypothetical protein
MTNPQPVLILSLSLRLLHVRLMRPSRTLSEEAYLMSIVLCAHYESPVVSEPLHHLFEPVEIDTDHFIPTIYESPLSFFRKPFWHALPLSSVDASPRGPLQATPSGAAGD